jgi:hypothetical protein
MGRDFARRFGERPGTSRVGAALVVGVLLGALLLVALRIDILRMRYAVSRALEQETELRGRQREFVLETRRLRHPGRLAEIALDLGYVRPTDLVRLPPREAGPGRLADGPADLPAVAAAAEERP